MSFEFRPDIFWFDLTLEELNFPDLFSCFGRHQKQSSPSQGRHQNKQFAFQGNQGKQTVSPQNQENYHKQSVNVNPQSTGHSYSKVKVVSHSFFS
jgi:hypothetical protein